MLLVPLVLFSVAFNYGYALEYTSHMVPTDTANNITIHVVTAGACNTNQKNAIVMLHGFPEGWSAWLEMCDYIGTQGYCCVMPDQRGYNQSSAPKAVNMYTQQQLVTDALAIFQWLPSAGLNGGSTRAFLFAHDWGGAISWSFTHTYPYHVRALVGFDSPHPNVLLRLEHEYATQRNASDYFLFFIFPSPIPENQLSAHDYAPMLSAFTNLTWATKERLNNYLYAYRTAGLTGGLNYYRANLQVPAASGNPLNPDRLKQISSSTFLDTYTIAPPVLLFWGKQDSALLWPLWPEATVKWCNTSIEIVPLECGHFSEHRVDLVQPHLIPWLKSVS